MLLQAGCVGLNPDLRCPAFLFSLLLLLLLLSAILLHYLLLCLLLFIFVLFLFFPSLFPFILSPLSSFPLSFFLCILLPLYVSYILCLSYLLLSYASLISCSILFPSACSAFPAWGEEVTNYLTALFGLSPFICTFAQRYSDIVLKYNGWLCYRLMMWW